MKHLRKKALIGLFVMALVLSFIALPNLQGVSRDGDENPIRFSPDDSMKTLRAKLQLMREEIARNGDTFEVGINSALLYPLEQLCSLNTDFTPADSFLYENNEDDCFALESALPASYLGYYTSIKNAGNCASGWAFVTVGVLEGAIKKVNGVTTDLSEQYLVDCNTSGYTCSTGGYYGYYMLMTPYGARYESCYPYTAVKATCSTVCPAVYRISGWAYIGTSTTIPTVTALKQKIYDYGSVACGVYVDTYFQAYTSGCFSRNATGSANHPVILIGWNDTQCITSGAFRLKNDWGTSWGDSGYMWIKYGVQKIGYGANYVIYP